MMGRPRDLRERRLIRVSGVVQGVGFRPFVYVTATELGLTGSVATTPTGPSSRSRATGRAGQFARRSADEPPPLAMVESIESTELDVRGGTGFVIESSRPGGRTRTLASADVATCADCLSELAIPMIGATDTRSSPARTAGLGSPSSPRCPMTGPQPRWPTSAVRGLPSASTTIPVTGVFTPSQSGATIAARYSNSSARKAGRRLAMTRCGRRGLRCATERSWP